MKIMNRTSQHFDYECAGMLLVDQDSHIVAQHRDNKPTILSAGLASFFGGRLEGDESPREAALRELHEETNIRLTLDDIEPWLDYIFDIQGIRESEHLFIAKGISTDGLEVYEGQGYHIITSLEDPLLAPVFRPAAQKWFKEREYIFQATAAHPEVHRYAAAFLVTPDGTLYGQLRDNKPGIDQPGKVGAFGGMAEAGETPLDTVVRELNEETNLAIQASDVELFDRFVIWRPLTKEYEQATIYIVRNVNVENIEVYEGQGIAKITSVGDHTAVAVRPALKKWFRCR